MLPTLLRLEWRHLRRDTAFWIATAVLALAVIGGLASGFAWTRFQQETIDRARTMAEERLAAAKTDAARYRASPPDRLNPNLDPRDARGFEFSYLRRFALLPPTPAAPLAVGQSDLLPTVLRVTYRPKETFLNPYEIENPLRLLLGRFDATFVAIYLLPLGILAVSSSLLTREREAGTLALLASLPLSFRRWLAVRFLLRGGLFLGAFAMATLAGWLLFGGALEALESVLTWLVLALLYGGFWFALSWWVGARARTPAACALTLSGAWLAWVVILPATLNLLVRHLYPPPARAAFQDAVRHGTDEAQRRGSQLLAKYLEDHPELAPGDTPANENDFFRTRFAINAEIERLSAPLRARFGQQLSRQQSLIEQLRWLSPALVLHHHALTLAGTDRARHQRWLEAIDGLHARLVQFFEPRLLRSADFQDYDAVPVFEFSDPPPSRGALGPALAALLLPSLLFVLLGAARLRSVQP